MKWMTKEQLVLKGGLYFSQILDGLNQYPYDQVKGSYEQLLRILEQLMEGKTASYVEFYFGRITKQNMELFKVYLSEEEAALLWSIKQQCEIKAEGEYCFIKMDSAVCGLMLKISFHELLFCTFYFINKQISVWTNYDGELILFYGDERIKEQFGHKMIAKN